MKISGVWHEDKRYGPQVKVSLAESVPPSGDEALMAYLKRVAPRRRGPRLEAARPLRRARAQRDRRGPGARVPPHRPEPAARPRGRQVLERAALHPRPAPAARAARARLARPADRRRVRRARARHGPQAPVRAHERLRRRLPDRGHDRPRRRRPARLAGPPPRGGRARADRGRARGLHLPAGARAGDQGRDAAQRPAARRAARSTTWSSTATSCSSRTRTSLWAYRPPTYDLEVELGDLVERAGQGAPVAQARGRRHGRPHPGARAGGGRARRVHVAGVDRHRRPRHRQDGDDPADLRGGQGAEGVDRARRSHRPRGPPDGRVHGHGGVHDPLRARLDSRPGADARRDRGRPARRGRDVDGQPRAARHAAARGRARACTWCSSATRTSSRRSARASRSRSSWPRRPSPSPSSRTSSARRRDR